MHPQIAPAADATTRFLRRIIENGCAHPRHSPATPQATKTAARKSIAALSVKRWSKTPRNAVAPVKATPEESAFPSGFSPFAPRTSEITNRTTEQKTATMRHDSPWAISVGAVENTGEMASRSSQQTAADVPAIMRISQLSLRLSHHTAIIATSVDSWSHSAQFGSIVAFYRCVFLRILTSHRWCGALGSDTLSVWTQTFDGRKPWKGRKRD